MYIVINMPNITDFEEGLNNYATCIVKSLEEFEQTLNDTFGMTDLEEVTVFKLEGSIKPIKLKMEIKEVFVETTPKKRGIK